MQVTDREMLSTFRGGLNMSTFFMRDVRNQDTASYDALLEMMRREIINDELINHRIRLPVVFNPLRDNVEEDPSLN